jgi:hypothetical protein
MPQRTFKVNTSITAILSENNQQSLVTALVTLMETPKETHLSKFANG